MPNRRALLGVASGALVLRATVRSASAATDLTLDWAYYNPVSLVVKDQGWLEEALKADGGSVRWVHSLGSNKALEFLNAGSLQFGSTAGAAALLGRLNGNPIRSVYVYSKPEWTALVTRPDTGITSVDALRGKRIAVTKGTDPYIFLLRALDRFGLKPTDVDLVLIQHDQGRLALERGDVDAWAGLDPMMADLEVARGFPLFYRDPDANTYGVLNVNEQFANDNPAVVAKVIEVYERGRAWAIANPQALAELLAKTAKLQPAVAAKQLERTDLSNPRIGKAQRDSLIAAGTALQKVGVVKAEIDVAGEVDGLLDERYTQSLTAR